MSAKKGPAFRESASRQAGGFKGPLQLALQKLSKKCGFMKDNSTKEKRGASRMGQKLPGGWLGES